MLLELFKSSAYLEQSLDFDKKSEEKIKFWSLYGEILYFHSLWKFLLFSRYAMIST